MRSRGVVAVCCLFFVLNETEDFWELSTILALRLASDVHVRAILCREMVVE
jgi:hypothetical protein